MALVTCSFFSETLEVGTTITVVLPQPTETQIGVDSGPALGEPPVLYLLHGLSDDHTAWTRYTSIERYAAAAGLAVVMPAAGRSFYTDEVHGHPYWSYVADELPSSCTASSGWPATPPGPMSPGCRWEGTAP